MDRESEEAQKILEQKLGEAKTGESAPEDKPLPKVSPEDDIEKPIPTKTWKFTADYEAVLPSGEKVPQHFEREYIQKPLSYHAMIEFTGLFTRNLDAAMSGVEGLSVEKIIELIPDKKLPLMFQDGQLIVTDNEGFKGIDSILKSVLKVASYVPEFLLEAQCIWLRIPRNERSLMMDIWARPVDEGGMSMRAGEEMLSLFIEQNYDEIEYFLTKWWKGVLKSSQRAKARKSDKSPA